MSGIQFSGLASGLDTAALVEAMTLSHKAKHDTAVQEQKLLELKLEKYKEVNTKVMKFYDEEIRDFRLESTFNKTETVISNEELILFEGYVPEGTHTIEILGVAKPAQAETTSIKNALADQTVTGSTKLTDLKLSADEITKLGVTKEGGVEENLGLDENSTLDDLAKALSGKGIDAKFDSKVGAFQITSTENFDFTGTGLDKLGINGVTDAQQAEIKYNGMTITSDTNDFELDDMKFTIRGEGTVTALTQPDTEAVVEEITGFVNAYNELIEELNGLVNAEYNKDYMPLTDEEKEAMTEEEIKLWEDKIDSSLLRNDPVLERLTSTMRQIMGGIVEGSELGDLSKIGITTSSAWTENGKLHIDEEKLREAIDNNMEGVKELFIGVKGEDGSRTGGIAENMYESVSDMFKATVGSSSMFLFNDKTLQNNINYQEEEVDKFKARWESAEAMYNAQFVAMEKMLAEMNSQSSWLTSQLGGM